MLNRKALNLVLIIFAMIMIAVAIYLYLLNTKKQSTDHLSKTYTVGLTGSCRSIPEFIASLKMKAPSLDSRQQDGAMGLLIRDYAEKDSVWSHKSWVKSGYIGAFDRDEHGNIYVSPMPYVSLLKNRPKEQNRIYQIDPKSAEMSLFLSLPTKNLPNSKNPFGVMGLFYDCDTQSLYVSSLAGSKALQEKGVIYQIDTNTKKILSTLENIDVIGLGVFNTKKGKRLYFGSARNSHLFSIALDSQGNFLGEKRYELSLSQVKGGDSTVIKKVLFSKKKNSFYMTLKEIEFGFRLLAENNPLKKKYHFELDDSSNKWRFKGLSKE